MEYIGYTDASLKTCPSDGGQLAQDDMVYNNSAGLLTGCTEYKGSLATLKKLHNKEVVTTKGASRYLARLNIKSK